MKRLTGCPGEIVFRPLDYVDVEMRIPNVTKAREVLGFEAEVELDDGLERTIAWYRSTEAGADVDIVRLAKPAVGEDGARRDPRGARARAR